MLRQQMLLFLGQRLAEIDLDQAGKLGRNFKGHAEGYTAVRIYFELHVKTQAPAPLQGFLAQEALRAAARPNLAAPDRVAHPGTKARSHHCEKPPCSARGQPIQRTQRTWSSSHTTMALPPRPEDHVLAVLVYYQAVTALAHRSMSAPVAYPLVNRGMDRPDEPCFVFSDFPVVVSAHGNLSVGPASCVQQVCMSMAYRVRARAERPLGAHRAPAIFAPLTPRCPPPLAQVLHEPWLAMGKPDFAQMSSAIRASMPLIRPTQVQSAMCFLDGIPDGPLFPRSAFKSRMLLYGAIIEARQRREPMFVGTSVSWERAEDMAARTACAIETWGKQLRMLVRADAQSDAARTARAVLRVVGAAAKSALCWLEATADAPEPGAVARSEAETRAALSGSGGTVSQIAVMTRAQHGALLQALHPTCARCGLSEFEPALDKLRWCMHCRAARYCCRACQLADWPSHLAAAR